MTTNEEAFNSFNSDNLWFTSDLHFGHTNIIKYCNRPWADADEMNRGIMNSFNEVLNEDSILINLGDVTMNDSNLHWVPRIITGTHILIRGNHDSIWPAHKKMTKSSATQKRDTFDKYESVFTNVSVRLHERIKIDGVEFLASHVPYHIDPHDHDKHEAYRPKDEGLPLICGHVHDAWKIQGNQFNVGVDVNDFKPVPASEVLDWAKGLL